MSELPPINNNGVQHISKSQENLKKSKVNFQIGKNFPKSDWAQSKVKSVGILPTQYF
jgi:hypothetical protein